MTLQDKLVQQVEKLKQNGNGNGEIVTNTEILDNQGSTELVPYEGNDGIQTVSVVPEFAVSLAEASERLKMLQEFVKHYMIPEQDYGLIPGCQKPSLFKSGAEKLCDVYGFSKHLEVTNRIENWEKGIFAYEVKASVVSKRTGLIEAEAVATANSLERKYAKKNGFDIQNTIIKMAHKRALVSAVLSATRSSGLFTQDVEDMMLMGTGPQKPEPAQNQPQGGLQKPNADQHDKGQFPVKGKKEPVMEEQLKQIYALAKELALTAQQAKQIMQVQYKVNDSKKLDRDQAADLIRRLAEQKKCAESN